MLEHGGRLRQAAKRYGIPLSAWLDLSTGINPNGWPVPSIPVDCWQRLPEDDDGLIPAASAYYQNTSLLPVAGTQAAIQSLPFLRPFSRVGVLNPAYAEHAVSWQKAGHQVRVVNLDLIEAEVSNLDVLILINPNNPTGKLWSQTQLLTLHDSLSRRGGWLIVDEAFMDGNRINSLSALPVRPGLIVLRSIGKFFGLAGIRCGFVIAAHPLLNELAEQLGPWPISHPGRYIATKALIDYNWQQHTAMTLAQQSLRLSNLLTQNGWQLQGGCNLFQWSKIDNAEILHDLLAAQGILTRLFRSPPSLRVGLPKNESGWQQLTNALTMPEIKYLSLA